ncbi:MAG: hypothetical protein CMJ18_13815 [Phycisphaeraceae bacterium]|nr:hypothetical protein [Phycisphaeraceae bacterium]
MSVDDQSDSPDLPDGQPGADARISIPRVLAICIPLLVVCAFLVEVVQVFAQLDSISGGVLPPAAILLFLPIVVVYAFSGILKRHAGVGRGELVVIFSVLTMGVPLFSGGFWHHFVANQFEYHRTRDLDRAMLISSRLWPSEANLLEGHSVEDHWPAPDGRADAGVTWVVRSSDAERVETPLGDGPCVRIAHAEADGSSEMVVTLDLTRPPGPERAARRHAVFAHLRLDGADATTSVTLHVGVPEEEMKLLATVRSDTAVSVSAPDRFVITGGLDYTMPPPGTESLNVAMRFKGRGTIQVRDFSIVGTEDVFRYMEGYQDADAATFATLSPSQQRVVRRRPECGLALDRHTLVGLIPWRVWGGPLLLWACLVTALFVAMVSLVNLFQSHWERGERLTFPLTTFVLEATRGDGEGRIALWRQRPFWIGLAVFGGYVLVREAMTAFDPHNREIGLKVADLLPPGPLREITDPKRSHTPLGIRIDPIVVAIALFMSVEMSGSLFICYLVGWLFRAVGFFTPLRTYRPEGLPYFGWFPFERLLEAGGLLFMVLYCLVTARRHLGRVIRGVLPGGKDPPREVASSRLSLAGLCVAGVLMTCFAWQAGLNAWFVLGYLGVMLLLALSAARIRAETGLPTDALVIPWPIVFIMALGGVLMFGFGELTFTAQTYFVASGSFMMVAPLLSEAMYAAGRAGVSRRRLVTCMSIGFAVAMCVGGLVMLSWAYSVGALNMNLGIAEKRGYYNRVTVAFEEGNELVDRHFRDHPEVDPVLTDERAATIRRFQPGTLVITAAPIVVGGLVSLTRIVWLGFPLHPIGFALSFTRALDGLWASIGVAWIIKLLVLRFGGVRLVRQFLKPLAVGVILGQLSAGAIWKLGATYIKLSGM